MKNPNALAAAASSLLAIGVQWLLERYAHVRLDGYWKAASTGGASVVVLYVGKHGLKAALGRVWNGPKIVWSGAEPKPPVEVPPPA